MQATQTLVCQNCSSGTFKEAASNEPCQACPQDLAITSVLGGATSAAECRCQAGEYSGKRDSIPRPLQPTLWPWSV